MGRVHAACEEGPPVLEDRGMTQAEMFYSFIPAEDHERQGPRVRASISAPYEMCWQRGDDG